MRAELKKLYNELEVSVQAYSRGTQVVPQDLDDEDFTLVIDQANYFAFKIDDSSLALAA